MWEILNNYIVIWTHVIKREFLQRIKILAQTQKNSVAFYNCNF